jgi:16S rRNA G1207 methylase RsmC
MILWPGREDRLEEIVTDILEMTKIGSRVVVCGWADSGVFVYKKLLYRGAH